MFISSWKVNFTISCLAFLFVFIGSISTNTLSTSFFRGSLTFVFFFIFSYLFRGLLMLASKDISNNKAQHKSIEETKLGNDKVNEADYTNEEITKASQYVKDLIND